MSEQAISLRTGVSGVLSPAYGGTGSAYGTQRLVVPCANTEGSTLPLYALVQLRGGSQDLRVKKVVDANSRKVFGAVVGYFDNDGLIVEASVPDGALAAVCIAGPCRILIESDVIRGQFIYSAATDGTITSSATFGDGAFGRAISEAHTSNGDTFAWVHFPIAGSGSTVITAHSALTGLTTGDDHTQYQKESEKDTANGYAGLDSSGHVPTADLGTGTADSTTVLFGDQVYRTVTAGGGSGWSWTQDVNETGASFSNWSVVVGTWSSDGTNIQQTDSTSSQRIAKYTHISPRRNAVTILEMEFRFIDTSSFAALYLFNGANNSLGWQFGADLATHKVVVNQPGAGSDQTFNYDPGSLSTSTWYKIRAVVIGNRALIYWGGTFVGTAALPGSFGADQSVLGLIAWRKCDFRNIKGWTADINEPA